MERIKKVGSYLLSHPGNEAVPSALRGLTSLFGMGRGVSPAVKPPTLKFLSELRSFWEKSLFCSYIKEGNRNQNANLKNLMVSPRTISTPSLNVSPHLHVEPIDLVIFQGPYWLMPWDT